MPNMRAPRKWDIGGAAWVRWSALAIFSSSFGMGLAEARECVFPMPAVLRPAMYGLSSTEDGLIGTGATDAQAGSLNGGGRVVISSLVPPAVCSVATEPKSLQTRSGRANRLELIRIRYLPRRGTCASGSRTKSANGGCLRMSSP